VFGNLDRCELENKINGVRVLGLNGIGWLYDQYFRTRFCVKQVIRFSFSEYCIYLKLFAKSPGPLLSRFTIFQPTAIGGVLLSASTGPSLSSDQCDLITNVVSLEFGMDGLYKETV
jgi:hypothetical protein